MDNILETQMIIRNIGHNLISNYENNHEILMGVNGPYDDEELRTRNLCHLIIITSIEILKYDKKEYVNLLAGMGKELLASRRENGFFDLRRSDRKDSCNGVIGHAWILEGLIYLYKVFGDEIYLDICKEIAEAHKFNEKLGLWYIPFDDKHEIQIDYTFNHQLWYAAVLAELLDVKKLCNIEQQLNIFLEKLDHNMCLSLYGKISHSIFQRDNFRQNLKQRVKRGLDIVYQIFNRSSYAYKEEGYHVFNLLAFARIYNFYKDNSFFFSSKFQKALEYINTNHFKKGLLNDKFDRDISLDNSKLTEEEKEVNIYGFPYNVPGFELLYVNECFKGSLDQEVVKWCIGMQFNTTYDASNKKFGLCCHDKNTINYRIYEYYRYLELIK